MDTGDHILGIDPDYLAREVRKLERIRSLLRRSVGMTEFPWEEVLAQAEAMDWSMEATICDDSNGANKTPIRKLLEAICDPYATITFSSWKYDIVVVSVGDTRFIFPHSWHCVIEALIERAKRESEGA